MRDKTALEFSGLENVEKFCTECAIGGLNFPIFASVRVRVRKTNRCATEHKGVSSMSDVSQVDQPERSISAVIVEATEQDFDMPKSTPNASHNFLYELRPSMGPAPPDRMVVAPASAVKHSPHGGLIVQEDDGTRHSCASVVTLLAHVGRCVVDDLPSGHRIATAATWNIPFTEGDGSRAPTQGVPAHSDQELDAKYVSYCSSNNVQFYTLSASKPRESIYALVVLGSSHVAQGVVHFMMNKVYRFAASDMEAIKKHCRKLWSLCRKAAVLQSTPASQKRDASSPNTPFQAKRTRRLCLTPTDASIDE